jgi:hypothetical protein
LLPPGSAIKKILCSPEACIDAQWLVQELARPHTNAIVGIEGVRRIDVAQQPILIEASSAGRRLQIQAKAVVFSAGTGNRELLVRTAAGGPHSKYVETLQQIRKSFMLIVRGSPDKLKPLTGVFPGLGGLFVVFRHDDLLRGVVSWRRDSA